MIDMSNDAKIANTRLFHATSSNYQRHDERSNARVLITINDATTQHLILHRTTIEDSRLAGGNGPLPDHQLDLRSRWPKRRHHRWNIRCLVTDTHVCLKRCRWNLATDIMHLMNREGISLQAA